MCPRPFLTATSNMDFIVLPGGRAVLTKVGARIEWVYKQVVRQRNLEVEILALRRKVEAGVRRAYVAAIKADYRAVSEGEAAYADAWVAHQRRAEDARLAELAMEARIAAAEAALANQEQLRVRAVASGGKCFSRMLAWFGVVVAETTTSFMQLSEAVLDYLEGEWANTAVWYRACGRRRYLQSHVSLSWFPGAQKGYIGNWQAWAGDTDFFAAIERKDVFQPVGFDYDFSRLNNLSDAEALRRLFDLMNEYSPGDRDARTTFNTPAQQNVGAHTHTLRGQRYDIDRQAPFFHHAVGSRNSISAVANVNEIHEAQDRRKLKQHVDTQFAYIRALSAAPGGTGTGPFDMSVDASFVPTVNGYDDANPDGYIHDLMRLVGG